MIDEVKISDIIVNSYRKEWSWDGDFDEIIDEAKIDLINTVENVVPLTAGLSVTIKRGFTGTGEDFVFEGQITKVTRDAGIGMISLICKSQLIDAIKSRKTYSWDEDIDTEAGIGSEIFKSICDNSSLLYDSSSIVSTGSGSGATIKKFIQNDEDDFSKMNELAEYYDYTVRYVPQFTGSGNMHFKPLGNTVYPYTLLVGSGIQKQIKWKENMEDLINKVKIQGATVYDKVVETGTGPTLTLTKMPEDTEVRQTDASGTLLTRGQKDLGTLGTDFDYYIDADEMTINFQTGSGGTFWVRYGAQVPMPIILSEPASIASYGGPNLIPHYKKFFYSDIKDIADAEKRGRAKLAKYSTPFVEATNIQVDDSIIKKQFIQAGDLVTIDDPFSNKNVNVIVKNVKKKFPHIGDLLTVGDKLWKVSNWEANVEKKIAALNAELNKNTDILTTVTDLTKDLSFKNRYCKFQSRDLTNAGTGIFIVGHPTFGRLGIQTIGDSTGISYVDKDIVQNENIYKEYLYDDDFLDTGTGTGYTLDTTNKRIILNPAGELASAHFPFNSDANGIGTYGINFDATVGMSYVAGKIGNAASFDGSTSLIRYADDSRFDLTDNNWSVAFWAKPADYTQADLLNKWSLSSDAGWDIYYENSGVITMFMVYDQNDTVVRSTGTGTLNTWEHIAFVRDYGTIRVYRNGELDSTHASGPVKACTEDVYFGNLPIANYFYEGLLDDVRIMNTSLSSDQIATLYNTGSGTEAFIPDPAQPTSISMGPIALGKIYKWFTFNYGTLTGTGTDANLSHNISYKMSANNKTSYTTLTKNIRTSITGTGSTGSGIYLHIYNHGAGTGYIANTYDSQLDYTAPGLYLKMEEA